VAPIPQPLPPESPSIPLGIDFRPKLANNFDERHSFHLSVTERLENSKAL
jgi:hypothetical protein